MWGTKTCSGGLGWAVQFGLSANSCVLHPKQRASNSTCCDGQRQHNLSEHLREKQEEPRRSCTAISLACPHGVSVLIPLGCRCCKLWLLVQLIMPLCPTVGYFVLLQVLDSLQTFFLTQPVTILVWLLISAASQSLTCQSQLQRWCLRLEDGWQHLPSETCTHQE